MNSFRFLERGINAEIARQSALLEAGERGRAGDAALRPAHGRDHVAALQGGGARLPLLPRARPRPARDRPRRCSSARARRAARAAGRRAPSATSASSGSAADSARLLALRAELGDYFEAALAAPTARRAAAARQLGDASSRARSTARTRPPRSVDAGGARGARRRWSARQEVTQGAAHAGARPARRRGRRPGRDRRARGPGAMGGGDELEPVVPGGARRQPGRRSRSSAAAT